MGFQMVLSEERMVVKEGVWGRSPQLRSKGQCGSGTQTQGGHSGPTQEA